MLIDSHFHLQDEKYDQDRDPIVKTAIDHGVEKMICIGTSVEDSLEAVNLSAKYKSVYAVVGIYPHEKIPQGDFREKLEELSQNKKVVAIGECGLDYTNMDKPETNSKEVQKELFRKQIGLAIQLGLPVVIHNREADNDTIEELSRYKDTGKLTGVFHCFTQTTELAKKVMDLGFYISFTAIITYPSAKHLVEVANLVPRDRVLIETDAPYLPPQTERGKRNEPKNVRIVADKLAEIWGISAEEVADITTKNASRLFNLK